MTQLVDTSITALQQAMTQGEVTAEGLVEGYQARIQAYDSQGPELNAVRLLNPGALQEARDLDRERKQKGPRGPLHGIPILVKDNYDVAGLPTTAGSLALEGLVAEQDAFVIERLREAGVVTLAKTNLHELAAGITSISSAGGRVRNPYDTTRNPGGSSGGTGSGVAASLGAIGLGSDTCGSIRIPAAFNSCVGLRATQGVTSRRGVVPLCLTQDVVGPIARTVTDLALVLDAMVGEDAADSQTERVRGRRFGFAAALRGATLKGRRIGRLDTLFGSEPEDQAVAKVAATYLARAEALGAEIVPVEIPELIPLLDLSFSVILGELPGDLEAYLATHPSAPVKNLSELMETGLVHPEAAPVLMAAAREAIRKLDVFSEQMANREKVRDLIERQLDAAGLDVFAYPPILRTPEKLGIEQPGSNAHTSANSGLPAISFPAGFTTDGLPVGLEFLGRSFADEDLVAMAFAMEQGAPARRAPTTTPEL